MADVSRAMLLPDVGSPSDQLVKTLALYWDEIVLPEYLERAGRDEVAPAGHEEHSETVEALMVEGVIAVKQRLADLPSIDQSEMPEHLRDETVSSALQRLGTINAPVLELIERNGGVEGIEKDELIQAAHELVDNAVDYAARQYLMRIRDSFDLSSSLHLAPVAGSAVSHVASITGGFSDAPRTEAALLSTAIQAFEVDPGTPIERIMKFRERNVASLGRLRASLSDLSEGLRQDADPSTLLAEARDRYRNRVVPALSELEEVLKEGKIRFLIRSLMGATAITLTPVDPVRAVEGGAMIMGQTIDYSFSREKVVREHPFGYLHQVSEAFGAGTKHQSKQSLERVIKDPEKQVREIFLSEMRDGPLLDRINQGFWFTSLEVDEEDKGT